MRKRRFMTLGLTLSTLALFGMLAPAAAAGHCYGYSYSYPTATYYAPPVQYYPVIQEKIVYKDREVQVPYAKVVYQHKDYYYGLKDYYQDRKRDDIVAEAAAYKALLLQVQMQNAAGQRQGGGGYGVQPGAALLPPGGYGANPDAPQGYGVPPAAGGYGPPPGGYAPQAQSQAPPQGYAPQAPPQGVRPQAQPQAPSEAPEEEPKPQTRPKPKPRAALTDVDPKLQAAVNAACIRCHNGKPDRMDLRNLAALNVGERAYMQALVEDGTMPEGGEPLDNDTAKLFAKHTAKAHKAIKLARK